MKPQYDIALADFRDGIGNWQMWGRLGWLENKRRYRRTIIGPFWTTLSLGIFIGVLGFIWSKLWGQDPKVFLPYLCSGMLVWTLMATIIGEGCGVFVAGEGLIKQHRFPYSLLACNVVWRNVIGFFHNLLIFVFVGFYAEISFTWYSLLFFPGLVLIFINGIWVCLLFGMFCSRFRDIQQVITSILAVCVFVTPIFFSAEQLGERGNIVIDYNILFHYLNIVRSPLLGQAPSALNWIVTICGTLVGWAVTVFCYSRLRRRIPYWL